MNFIRACLTLDPPTIERLAELARVTGFSKSFVVRELVGQAQVTPTGALRLSKPSGDEAREAAQGKGASNEQAN